MGSRWVRIGFELGLNLVLVLVCIGFERFELAPSLPLCADGARGWGGGLKKREMSMGDFHFHRIFRQQFLNQFRPLYETEGSAVELSLHRILMLSIQYRYF